MRAHKTHLDPSWPSSRYPPPLTLLFSLALSPYPRTLLFPDPSAEVNKDGQIMERPHEGRIGITSVKRVG